YSSWLNNNKSFQIVGQLLVDHALSYALTATTNVLDVYLQQFWKTIRLVVNANEEIRFMVDKKETTYTVDMFRSTLKLLVETPKNPFVALANMKFIQPLLKIVRYQGDADKVSAFYTKYLAQPWKTMFKVFNHFLTLRTYVHDQTKINILQIFHDEVNHVNVNYVGLLWWDFIHYIQQKKDVIQYPCFTKLILVDLMKKFDSIPQRLKEDYHSINDDIPLSRWMKLFNEYGFKAKYHLGKANVVVESWSRKKSEAKNKFWINVAWLGPTSVKRDGDWFILVRQGSDLQLERCNVVVKVKVSLGFEGGGSELTWERQRSMGSMGPQFVCRIMLCLVYVKSRDEDFAQGGIHVTTMT
ncbi:hypothetical protein Tco_0098222, partial [Tanacetum coccineum]